MAPTLSSKQWALPLIILALLLCLSLRQFLEISGQKLNLSFLNVGQGDAILIQTPEYRNILIDTGPDGKVVEELSRHLGFFNQQIDLFILTHPDLDHYGGIMDILQKYPVKSVMLTGIASDSGLYNIFINELRERQINILYPTADTDLQIGINAYLDILYPFHEESLIGQEVKNKNDSSISMILRDGQHRPLALLTGDGEEALERDLLLSAQNLRALIYKLGHHGSKTSSSAALLTAIRPETVVVSAGKDNKFGHPHPEVMERVDGLKQLYTWDASQHFEF